ncbi:MAG: hypothetical protein ACXV5Q_14705 [Frankiaceae bacterium]
MTSSSSSRSGLSVGDIVTCRVLGHQPWGFAVTPDADVAGGSVDMVSTFSTGAGYTGPPPLETWPPAGSHVQAAIIQLRARRDEIWMCLSINPDHFHVPEDWRRVQEHHRVGTLVTGPMYGPFEGSYYLIDLRLPPVITARVDRNDLGIWLHPNGLQIHGAVTGFDDNSKSLLVEVMIDN